MTDSVITPTVNTSSDLNNAPPREVASPSNKPNGGKSLTPAPIPSTTPWNATKSQVVPSINFSSIIKAVKSNNSNSSSNSRSNSNSANGLGPINSNGNDKWIPYESASIVVASSSELNGSSQRRNKRRSKKKNSEKKDINNEKSDSTNDRRLKYKQQQQSTIDATTTTNNNNNSNKYRNNSRSNSNYHGQSQSQQLYYYNASDIPLGAEVNWPSNEAKQNSIEACAQQLDYYLGINNLLKDMYLRKHMNSDGWIQLKDIAQFARIKAITGGDIDVIKKSIDLTQNIESQSNVESDDFNDIKIRTKITPLNWVLPINQRLASNLEN